MVRQGWSVMELPADGWVKVLRGRRSPSEQWPMASKNTMGGETQSWAVASETSGGTRQSQEPRSRIVGALGPEDNCAKSKFRKCTGVPRRVVRQCVSTRTLSRPRVAKVERLQKALDALGGLGGPEVDAIKRALKKAQEVARERPIAELIKEFIDRSTKRISKLKTERPIDTVGSTSSASWRSC